MDYGYEDDNNLHVYTPERVPQVQPDAHIRPWTPPPRPSYMPQEEPPRQQQPPRQQPPPRNPDWSHYMTVSEEEVANPDELATKLAPTAPAQPHTPSPEEFMFAELKDLVLGSVQNVPHKDIAPPQRFDAYMTVSESEKAPPPAFVDAEIVAAVEEEEANASVMVVVADAAVAAAEEDDDDPVASADEEPVAAEVATTATVEVAATATVEVAATTAEAAATTAEEEKIDEYEEEQIDEYEVQEDINPYEQQEEINPYEQQLQHQEESYVDPLT